ncbi:MAG: hypothetical protein NVSMB51_03790 [Solirubrobacteraceae bacterium]
MSLTDRLRPIDAFQQRHPPLAFIVAVYKKFSDDGGGRLAALLAYYAFFSIFPLLLVLVTVLGFVLQGDPSAQRHVLNSALADFPVIGTQIAKSPGSLKGSGVALAVGLVGAILAGLGITQAAQEAFNRMWQVPMRERPDFLKSRLRGLLLLVLFGLLTLLSTAVSGAIAAGASGLILSIVGILVGVAVNLGLFLLAFRLLTSRELTTREVFPGALVAAALFALLQIFGGYLVNSQLRHASETYGTFAAVIGALSFLYFASRIVLLSMEVNVVRAEALWPRSLFAPPLTAADKRTLSGLAEVEERAEGQEISVSFERQDVD